MAENVTQQHVTKYVLDACALIAYFRNEEGGNVLLKLLKEPCNLFFIHSVNIGEIYYDSVRFSGEELAAEIFEDIANLPIQIIWTLDIPFLKIVGRYKTSYKISYADAFVLALAEKEDAKIISTDHHEFDTIEAAGVLFFYWLRS